MKARPIPFSALMVRALLQGHKTQTRRVAKNVRNVSDSLFESDLPLALISNCPYGQVGTQLYVKEAAWMWCEREPDGISERGNPQWHYVPMTDAPVFFQADHPQKPERSIDSPNTGNKWDWRLKIGRFLPCWASRLTLEITDVRLERLQDISEADAIAEGVPPLPAGKSARDWYRSAWEKLHGNGAWQQNPWVWVIEFERIKT